MKARHYNDTLHQALAYAEADASDPFTFNRVMSHSASRICDSNERGDDCRYKAERSVDSNGRARYTNVQRP